MGAVTLNARQAAFVRAFVETGNATEAYRRAYGASGRAAEAAASRLLRNVKVAAEVQKHAKKAEKASIATVEELHEFWSKVMRGDVGEDEQPPEWKDRLKASELRAKAAGVFVEKREVSGPGGGPQQHSGTLSIEGLVRIARTKEDK